MGRKSIRTDKNIFQVAREEAGLTREQASDLMGYIPASRIDKIEREVSNPQPADILAMAKAYKKPNLCNYYCSKECPIGQEFVPEVKVKDLSQIVLEVLSSLNKLSREKDRMIEISVDGKISEDEMKDFARIRKDLASISLTVDALQLWVNNTIANGNIDKDELEEITKNL